jgi:hypothetical protein
VQISCLDLTLSCICFVRLFYILFSNKSNIVVIIIYFYSFISIFSFNSSKNTLFCKYYYLYRIFECILKNSLYIHYLTPIFYTLCNNTQYFVRYFCKNTTKMVIKNIKYRYIMVVLSEASYLYY